MTTVPAARVVACALFVALGCAEPPPAEAPPPRAPRWSVEGDAARGRALYAEMECARCHTLEGEPVAAPHGDCVGCHRAILEGRFDAPPDALDAWSARIESLVHVPSLDGARARLSRDWVAAYLVAPHDVRPALAASMPRLAIDPRDAADLATFLVPDGPSPGDALPEGDATRALGRAAMERFACTSCHAFTGVPAFSSAPPAGFSRDAAIAMAPDLRFARERVRPGVLARWILDPRSVQPDSSMPRVGATREEAEAIEVYLLTAPLASVAPPSVPVALPLLDRAVTFAEVRERVLRRVCWHCHSDAELAMGDGGPGNTGGLGFPARGLDLSDYEGVMSGAIADPGSRADGEPRARRSIFRDAGGEPLLVAVLRARQREESGELGPLRGMPLGLPAVSPEDLQLVESWIAQGRPQ